MATFKRVGCSNSSPRTIERYFVSQTGHSNSVADTRSRNRQKTRKTERTPSKAKKRLLVDLSNDAEKPKRKKLQLSQRRSSSIRKGAPLKKRRFQPNSTIRSTTARAFDRQRKKIPPQFTFDETSGYLRRHVDVKRTASRELTLKLERKSRVIECILRDDWSYREIRPKDVVNIISDSYASPIVLDRSSESFLVLEPVSLFCLLPRLPWQRDVRAGLMWRVDPPSLVHEAFEASLKSGEFGRREVEISLKEKLKKLKWMESLYALNMSEVDALDSAKEFVSNFGKFADDFFGGRGSQVHIKK